VPLYGWTTQKVFHFLNFLMNGGERSISVVLLSLAFVVWFGGLIDVNARLPVCSAFGRVHAAVQCPTLRA
jgi:hypothetical protein